MTIQEFFDNLNSGASWAAGVSFQRSNPLPLDKYSVFQTYASAVEYATSNAVAYPGQVIAAYSDGTEEGIEAGFGIYYIDQSMALQAVGSKIKLDEISLDFNTDGLLEISGFKAAADLTLPQKQSDGSISWVGIDAIVEGDGNTTYKFALTEAGTGLIITPVDGGVDGTPVTVNFDVYTKAEVDNAINVEKTRAEAEESAIQSALDDEIERAKAAEKANADEITKTNNLLQSVIENDDETALNSIKELSTWVTEHGSEASEMTTNISNNTTAITALQKSVADKADAATTLEGYGITDAYTKAETEQAIADKVADVTGGESAAAVKLSLEAEVTRSTGKDEAHDSAISTINTKLATIEDNAQVNVIEIIKVNGTALDIADKTVNIVVPTDVLSSADKTELETAIAAAKAQADKGVTDAAAAAGTANAAKAATETNAANIETLQTTTAGHTTSIAEVTEKATQNASAIAALQTTVGEHSGSIGTLTSDLSTLAGRVDATETDITSLKAKDTELAGLIGTNTTDISSLKTDNTANKTAIQANKDAIATLVGETEGDNSKSVRAIATEVLTDALIPEDAKESLDTLQEIAAWIQSHPDDASAMNAAITKLNADSETEGSVDYKIAQALTQDFIINGGTASTNLYVA